MISHFFIPRPIFACVVSIVIILIGVISILTLPTAQYPEMTPPQVSVTTSYPGASPEVIADTVASVLENQINGVDNMIYMSSIASGNGSLTINVYFEVGTDPDQNTTNVNNRVQNVVSTLPATVQKLGVQVTKQSSAILKILILYSPDSRYDTLFMSNYALVNIIDDLKRLPGVGNATILGEKQYSMRIWLMPDKMAQLKVTINDISDVLNEQNMQYAAGRLGQPPYTSPADLNFLLVPDGRLATAEEFGEIIIRVNGDSSIVRLRDVAKVELAAYDYSSSATYNGRPAIAIGTYATPGANALDAAALIDGTMERLSKNFPDGVTYATPYDTTVFVRISLEEVVHTLFEAIILVFLVVFVFLQNWRATLIPCLAVPVSIIGTFGGMAAFGFSINTLTMFGMVLAIGIVVDDAIIVLEAVERIMEEEKLPPREATFKAMEEMQSPIIAIVLVLCSVFLPVSFLGGMTGEMYRQFAVTISISVFLSGVVALTLTPALCALILKPGRKAPARPFQLFNIYFDKVIHHYTAAVALLIKHKFIGIMAFVGLCALVLFLFKFVPAGLVPDEDQGMVLAASQLPDGASLSRTQELMTASTKIIRDFPYVEHVVAIAGIDLLSDFSAKNNSGTSFIVTKPWDERGPGQDAFTLARQIIMKGFTLPEAMTIAFTPPAIIGMSNTGGFEMYLQSKGGGSSAELAHMAQKLVTAAHNRPELTGVSNSFTVNYPQLKVELDRNRAKALQVSISDVLNTMGATFGSTYVNDFTLFNRNFKVVMQAWGDYRAKADDLDNIYVRSQNGDMIPLSALVNLKPYLGAEIIQRFNLFPAAKIMGNPAPGYSLGQAMDAMEELVASELTPEYAPAWTGSAYQQKQVGASSTIAFAMGLTMVFLILAAQYEKWSLPIAVIMAIPFAVFGALLAVLLRGLANDVYFQIALVMLIGLSAKNAILIVEFATMQREQGLSLLDSATEAARLRFRPILMTSFAFIFGCLPLAISSGAGAASRHSIGTGVVGGMTSATLLAVFFIPMFYYIIMSISERLSGKKAPPQLDKAEQPGTEAPHES